MYRVLSHFFIWLCLLCAFGLPGAQAQDELKVPKLIDLHIEEAWAILNENGFTMIVTLEVNTRFQPGVVFEQSPAAGKTISRETQVKLKVATGTAEVEVPDLMTLSLPEAQKALQAKQLSIIAAFKQTTRYPDSTVVGQEPPAGTIVTVGTPVSLSIADVPVLVAVPQLAGRPIGEVRVILSNLGLSMGASPEMAEKYPPGTVFEQNYLAGARVPVTTPVKVKVAITSDLVVVPNVTGVTFGEAWKRFRDVKLAVVTEPLQNISYQPGMVFGQSEPAGSKVPVGTPVTLKIATSPERTAVSNLSGQSIEEVEAQLSNSGIPTAVSTEVSSGFPPGAVIEQSIPAGSAAAVGTPIFIKLAVAPNTVEMPDLNGEPLSVVQAILQQNGLPMVAEAEVNSGSKPGTVFAQSAVSQSEIHVGTPVYLKIATGSQKVEVPNLTKRSLEEAGAILQAKKLSMAIKTSANSAGSPGAVIAQDVAAGSQVSVGSPLYLTVAVTPERVRIPDLTNRPVEGARESLQQAGLSTIFIPQENSETPAGVAFGQYPAAGALIPRGSPVYVEVATDSARVHIGNFEGRNLEEAQAILQNTQLTIIVIPQISPDFEPGTIIEQLTASDTLIPFGSPVYFKTALDTAMVEVPNCDSLNIEEAHKKLRALRLPMVVKPQFEPNIEPGSAFEQNPPDGTLVPAGSPVYFSVALGTDSSVVPNLAGRLFEDAWAVFRDIHLPMILFQEKTEEYPPGTLFEQITTPGNRVPVGTPIYLKMAVGLTEIEVPDLTSRPVDEARKLLSDLQLPLILQPEVVEGYQPGTVFEQSLTAGEQVLPGTPIFLKISAGTGTVELPNLVGRPLEEVRDILQNAGLQLIPADSTTNDYQAGTVLAQEPLAGSEVSAGASVRVSIATAPPVAEPDGSKPFSSWISLVLAGIFILLVSLVSFGMLKKRKADDHPPPAVTPKTETFEEGKEGDLESGLHFKSFPDIGRQYLKVSAPLILEKIEPSAVESSSFDSVAKSILPDGEVADIGKAALEINELLQSANFISFEQLAEALNFSIRLKAKPDFGKQKILVKGSLVLSEKIVLEAADKASASTEAVETGEVAEEDIEEAAARITDLFNTSTFATFAQLAAALSFRLALKAVPDSGKQCLHARGALILNDDLTRIEGIGPKIARLLQKAGMVSFTQLASTEAEDLQKILAKAKLKYIDPTTWPEQATLAAAGDWKALETLQETLKGGRRK